MTLAKIFLLGQEREVLWSRMEYYRGYRINGRPASMVIGGYITVSFTSQADDDIILYAMTKESQDDLEKDKMFDGKLCFYGDGFDYPPTKTYFYNDAFLIFFREAFSAYRGMETTITISPAIQHYGALLKKSWNVNNSDASEPESSSTEPAESHEPQIVDCYYTDLEGNKTAEPFIGDEVYLVVKTKDMIGEVIDIDLSNHSKDFMYNGEIIPDDTIPEFDITNDLHKIKLQIVAPQSEPIPSTKA